MTKWMKEIQEQRVLVHRKKLRSDGEGVGVSSSDSRGRVATCGKAGKFSDREMCLRIVLGLLITSSVLSFDFFLTACLPHRFLPPTTSFDDGFEVPATGRER